jgi:hypothetical protein
MPGNDLGGATADAEEIAKRLEMNEDGTPNYECRTLLGRASNQKKITRRVLREACRDLLTGFRGEALLYFSGHGVLTEFGGAPGYLRCGAERLGYSDGRASKPGKAIRCE